MKAIVAIIAVFLFVFPALTAFGGIRTVECPAGKFLFVEQPIAEMNDYKYLTAEVLVHGPGLITEKYLSKRSDGWTHLSSERSVILPFSLVGNCLPEGEYQVRIEYYTPVRLIGSWFLGSIEYQIKLNQSIYSMESRVLTGVRRNATLKDHLAMHWMLFAMYFSFSVLFISSLIILIFCLVKNRRHRF